MGSFYEVREGKIFYTSDSNSRILLIDPFETKPNFVQLIPLNDLEYSSKIHYDIIKISINYPENLYIVTNKEKSSFLLIYNIEEFIEIKIYERKPISIIIIIESMNTFVMCDMTKNICFLIP